MLKKTITYTDYNGEERKEDFYFNLSKAEIMEMQLSVDGGLSTWLEEVIQAKDVPTISKLFKDLILKSYGKKSADGVRFEKSEDISKGFEQSEAYSELFMELIGDSKAASDFFNAIIPKDLEEATKKLLDKQNKEA